MKEQWRDIPNYPNYEVSDKGNVRNKKTGRFLKPQLIKGYPRVVICNKGYTHPITIHRLVADIFYEGDHTGLQVNHIDGVKTNNSVDNLEWITCSDNLKHAYKTGLKSPPCPKPRKVRIVETGEIFESAASCARYIGGSKTHICECLDGTRYSHLGYHFEEII